MNAENADTKVNLSYLRFSTFICGENFLRPCGLGREHFIESGLQNADAEFAGGACFELTLCVE